MPIEGVHSEWLLNKIELKNKKLISKENVIKEIRKTPSKIVVMIGSGDIGVLINDVVKELKNKGIS